MNNLIRFSPALSQWLLENLNRGAAPEALQKIMIEQGMDSKIAQTIVGHFVSARAAGQPVPVDNVPAPVDEQDYLYGSSRLPQGSSIKTSDGEVRVLARAEKPTLALLGGLLSPEECAQLIQLARPRLQPSTIVDPATGKDVVAGHRSSYGMFFRLQETPFIAAIDRRISEVMNLPVENGEGLQILHYPAGAESALHFDFLVPSNPANQESIARSGQRVSTLVSYLNNVPGGGETIFPEAGWSVSPQRGNAVYFEYCNEHNQLDHRSLHGSAVVLSGEKWVASKWMRQRRFISAGNR